MSAVEERSASTPTIAVHDLSKAFQIPHEHVHTLKERALHPTRRRTFDRLEALTHVSFEVAPGEMFGIVGRNGSGKSTLLKCLAGIYRVDAGEIWLRGRVAPFIELGVGFNPDLTARDNVLINAIMLGLTPAEARARYDAVIEFAELGEFVDLKLKNYSSGMQVRLAFAVMVQVDADILLIDEVLAVGDAAFQQKCHDSLTRLRAEGRTILLITHDMQAIERFCDRAMLLERGGVVEIGAPDQVAHRYGELNFPSGLGEPERLGDGAAAVLDAWFEDEPGRRSGVLEHGRAASFHAVVEAASPLSEPIVGMRIEDAQGVIVFETSTTRAAQPSGDLAVGERVELAVRFETALRPGRYFASPSVAHAGSGELIDFRRRLTSIVVTGDLPGSGLVDIPHHVALERLGARTAGE